MPLLKSNDCIIGKECSLDNDQLKNITNINRTTITHRNNITHDLEPINEIEVHKEYPNMSAYQIMKHKKHEKIRFEERINFYCKEGYMFSNNGTELSYNCTDSELLENGIGSIFGCIGL